MKKKRQNELKRILSIIFIVGFILTAIVLAIVKNETYILLLLALMEIMMYAIVRTMSSR